jgi:hypothetical protein
VEVGWAGRKPRPGVEGSRWLGLGEGGGPREEEGEWPVADHTGWAERKEAGPKSLLGLKSKEVKTKINF